jgi:hypothetical protein
MEQAVATGEEGLKLARAARESPLAASLAAQLQSYRSANAPPKPAAQ